MTVAGQQLHLELRPEVAHTNGNADWNARPDTDPSHLVWHPGDTKSICCPTCRQIAAHDAREAQ